MYTSTHAQWYDFVYLLQSVMWLVWCGPAVHYTVVQSRTWVPTTFYRSVESVLFLLFPAVFTPHSTSSVNSQCFVQWPTDLSLLLIALHKLINVSVPKPINFSPYTPILFWVASCSTKFKQLYYLILGRNITKKKNHWGFCWIILSQNISNC